MKNQVEFKILILTGFVFVFSLFPFAYVDAAKFQSGVTINAPTTTPPPAGTCPDTNGDGIPDMTGGNAFHRQLQRREHVDCKLYLVYR